MTVGNRSCKIPFIDVFYHQSLALHPGHTARAPPLSHGGRVRTGDQTTARPMPWPLGYNIPHISNSLYYYITVLSHFIFISLNNAHYNTFIFHDDTITSLIFCECPDYYFSLLHYLQKYYYFIYDTSSISLIFIRIYYCYYCYYHTIICLILSQLLLLLLFWNAIIPLICFLVCNCNYGYYLTIQVICMMFSQTISTIKSFY